MLVWDPSARDALNTFLQAGQGDVLIGYENEAIFAQQAGQALEYVVPDSTLLIENAISTTSVGDAPDAGRRPSSSGCTRPRRSASSASTASVPSSRKWPRSSQTSCSPTNLATVDGDLGGWAEARPKFFDPEDGIMAGIFENLGIEN